MDEYELAERAYALPGRFADRLDPGDLATVAMGLPAETAEGLSADGA